MIEEVMNYKGYKIAKCILTERENYTRFFISHIKLNYSLRNKKYEHLEDVIYDIDKYLDNKPIEENENISELLKEKVVIEEKPCKRLDIKSDDCPFMNDKDIANIPTTMEKIYVKKPIELSDVIDKLNEVIRKVNGE